MRNLGAVLTGIFFLFLAFVILRAVVLPSYMHYKIQELNPNDLVSFYQDSIFARRTSSINEFVSILILVVSGFLAVRLSKGKEILIGFAVGFIWSFLLIVFSSVIIGNIGIHRGFVFAIKNMILTFFGGYLASKT